MNIPNFQITPFHPKFEREVKSAIGELLVYTGVIQKSDLPVTDADLSQIPKIYSGKGKFWVAMIGDKVIGTVGIKDEGNNVAKLKRMFVRPEYHGTGVGEALLAKAEEFAKAQGFTKLILNTDAKMHRAHHFYEKHGFVQVEEFHCDEQSPAPCRLHYEKEL